jgi:hypothetical protein
MSKHYFDYYDNKDEYDNEENIIVNKKRCEKYTFIEVCHKCFEEKNLNVEVATKSLCKKHYILECNNKNIKCCNLCKDYCKTHYINNFRR